MNQHLLKLITLLEKILAKKLDDDEYSSCANSIGKKLITHVKTIDIIINSIYDISSNIAITRAALESYSVFYILYIKGTKEERLLRFNLWKLNGLKDRQKFNIPLEDLAKEEQDEMLAQQEDERKQILAIKEIIEKFSYYEKIPIEFRPKLVNRSVWNFDESKLNNYTSKKQFHYGIKLMIESSDIKKDYLENIYSFYSMHAHTNYISILQSEQLTKKSYQNAASHLYDLNSILIVYFINSYLSYFNLDIKNYCDSEHVYYNFKQEIEKSV